MNLAHERIVVTGGGGFLGHHVRQELLRSGVPAEQILVPRRRQYDLTRETDVARMYAELNPSVLIHLAAEVGGIGANRAQPARFFYANTAMGLHLIEHARRRKTRKFIQIGTVCSYPRLTPIPFTEDALWDGYPDQTNAPYGIAKKALLVMLQAYRQQYGLNGVYLIAANLYGPHDNFDPQTSHVIPALIYKFLRAIENGEDTVTVWGTGAASREFLYVEDAARAIVLASELYDEPAPLNIGSGQDITIRALAEQIQELTGFDGQLVWDASKPDGQPRRRLDTRRAEQSLGFRAQVSLAEGLERTTIWYRDQQRRATRTTVAHAHADVSTA
jgi:GDP-L-fucose synthase